jgi:hypothetical protein
METVHLYFATTIVLIFAVITFAFKLGRMTRKFNRLIVVHNRLSRQLGRIVELNELKDAEYFPTMYEEKD